MTDGGGGGNVITEAEISMIEPQATRNWKRKTKQNKTISPLEPLEVALQPCIHLDFRLLDSETEREQNYAALSHYVCSNLLTVATDPSNTSLPVYTHYSIT